MNPKSASLFALILFGFSFIAKSQPEILTHGDFSIVAKATSVRLLFSYDSIIVGKMKEADYVKKRVAERNKKLEGDGDAWEKNWYGQRKADFEPVFTEYFLKSSGKQLSDSAGYTLIFHTRFIEPGFSSSAILIHKNPEIRGELLLVKTGEPATVLARAEITKAMGHAGPHFETGDHINGCYATAGEDLGTVIGQ